MTREAHVLRDDYTPSPKLSVSGDRWAVVAATKTGVKVAIGTMDDLKEPKDPVMPTDPPKPEPPATRITQVTTTVDGSTLRAEARIEGPWDWIIWRITATTPNATTLLKVDDRSTAVEGLATGTYHVTAEAVRSLDAETVLATIAEPVKPEDPKPEILPWIDISVTVPTPGSGPNAAMLDRGRLQAIKDLGVQGVRYNLHYMRLWDDVVRQVELYAEYFPIEHHLPIIDWSEQGTSPDADANAETVPMFAVKVVKAFGFPFVELGNEVWQHDSPTSEYFRVAVPVAQALLAQTDCKVGICADYQDYGNAKRRVMVDFNGLAEFLDDDSRRLIACVHPYPNPAHNRVDTGEIQRAFQPNLVYASEWGVKNTDVVGLLAGMGALRRANIPLVSLYVYDDGPPDFMGLLKSGHVRTATGEALAAYIAQMRKDHGRETPPDPVVPPDPITVKPVIPPAHAMSGDFLNGYGDFTADNRRALFLLPAYDRAERRNMLSVYAGKHPGGAVPFGAWGGYAGLDFDYRQNPSGLIEVIEDVHAAGCKPILFCFADNFGAKRWSLQQCLDFVEGYLPQVTPALGDDPFLVLSWEGEQSLDALARTRQDDVNPWDRWEQLLRRIRRLEPRGELGIHLPPNEWSPLIRHTGKGEYRDVFGHALIDFTSSVPGRTIMKIDVDPNAGLRRMQKAGATALLMQWAPEMRDDDIVEEGHVSAAGPGAKPDGGIVARVVRAGMKYYLFEARRTAESARRLSDRVKALNNPGVSGGANGWTR